MTNTSYFVFIDILGYKDYILSLKDKKDIDLELKRIQKALDKAKYFIEPHDYWQIKFFSDNLAIQHNLQRLDGSEEGHFGTLVFSLCGYQLFMVLSGYFVRGAWSFGYSFMNDDLIFGKPLIEAYKLESENAIYPRIIISNDVKKLVDKHLKYYSPDYFPPQAFHLIKQEEIYFLNYLCTIKDLGDKYTQKKILYRHKRLISRQLDKWQENDKIFNKYKWVAEYHNFFIEKFTGFTENWLKVRTGKNIYKFELLVKEF